MANDYFQFKQFIINQDQTAMKVGVDGVLLGAWTISPTLLSMSSVRILDIGTGTGLLSLMLAQKIEHAKIDAIEIDTDAYNQARKNVSISKWADRISVIRKDFRHFTGQTIYDLIICNPPFFTASLKSPDMKRNIARHNDSLPHDEMIKGVSEILSRTGFFTVILPSAEAEHLIVNACEYNLHPQRILRLQSHPQKAPYRLLIEFSKTVTSICQESLCIHINNSEFTNEYKELTKDFYLKF